MDLRKVAAFLRRELNDFETMIACIEDRMAANREQGLNNAAPRIRAREWIARLHPPFQEPEFGLWLQKEN